MASAESGIYDSRYHILLCLSSTNKVFILNKLPRRSNGRVRERKQRGRAHGGGGNAGRWGGRDGKCFSNCEDFDHTRRGVKRMLEKPHYRPVEKSEANTQARRPGYFFFFLLFLPNSLALSPLYSMVPSGQTMYVYSQVTIISQTKGFLVIAKNTSVSSGTSSRMWL